MRKFLVFIAALAFFVIFSSGIKAASDLDYKSFESEITINQDKSITVQETVDVDYLVFKHGIFRDIPERRIRVLSVKDQSGNDYKYKVSGGAVKEIKIGDPDKTITGEHTYVITYQLKDAVKEFPDHYELYWNVTGSEWDSTIPTPTATVESPYAQITGIKCYAGIVGTSYQDCSASTSPSSAHFESGVDTGVGSDFTIVVGLSHDNQFTVPSTVERIVDWFMSHWPYFASILPFFVPFYFWVKKGRDERYASENIYYEPTDTATRRVGFFERKYIPLVYSPIKGLTPAQVGTIIDEKVDIQDVVSEITELARLGYLKIKKIDKKWIFGKVNYEFTNLKKDSGNLADYQQIVLDGLFESGDKVQLSDLRNKFYKNLKDFKDSLYKNMASEGFFAANPESVRTTWLVVWIVIIGIGFFCISWFADAYGDSVPVLLLILSSVFGFLFVRSMPRRTPKGYALYRQIRGLKWYIEKGHWKQEIAEKRLFVDEILPLAVSLGVVTHLAHDMEVLKMVPPSYIAGSSMGTFSSDLSSFQSSTGKSLSSSPSSSGSGFSGGSSGGGGGGGGGGGW